MHTIPHQIFKAYDIRGIVGESLTPEIARLIGYAFGRWVGEQEQTCAIGRDGRLSSQALSQALSEGLCAAGIEVLDLGAVTTPMAYFATHVGLHPRQTRSAIMVTGSHNPPNYNGFKMVLHGTAIYGEKIQALYQSICNDQLQNLSAVARRHTVDHLSALYQQRVMADVKLSRPMKIAIDCGNGIAGAFAPALFKALGCEVTELFCTVDGNFPNHHPDPANPDNLADLINCLKQTDCEIGLAFDGDGDRLGVVSKNGDIIYPDRQLMLFSQDVLNTHPNSPIIYDVKCSANLARWIHDHGGQPLIWKTGHSLVKAKLKETNAPLAGEMSGHIFFNDRWYGFDDGLYAGARLLEILSHYPDATEILNRLPDSLCTPELHLACTEQEADRVLTNIKNHASFNYADQILTIDGIRVDYPDGFGLIRASNTTPILVMRFEADNLAALHRIQMEFKHILLKEKPDALLPF
jgi:phosphomannomutase/phosphoglucomutase